MSPELGELIVGAVGLLVSFFAGSKRGAKRERKKLTGGLFE